jgi:hypothetical protein
MIMKTRLQISLFALIGFISANLLCSCAPKSNSIQPLNIVTPPNAAPKGSVTEGGGNADSSVPVSGLTAHGTSDSGGGTGVDGKVFESYIVDPTELPAYKQFVAPLLKNIKTERPDGTQFDQVIKIKTWYIAPVDLEKINKDILGISFVKSDTQQIARQTMKEVWIDKHLYDQMAPQEQGQLLLHEFVMNIYLIKFMLMSDLYRSSEVITGKKYVETGSTDINVLDKIMPLEMSHPLTDQDNENIRFVTGWMLQNLQKPVLNKDFIQLLFYKNFDKRFYSPQNADKKATSLADLKMPFKEFYRAIKGAELSDNMPNSCFGETTNTKKACKIYVEEKTIKFGLSKLQGIDLHVKVEGEAPLVFTMFVGDEVQLTANQDRDQIIYSYSFLSWQDKNKIGDRVLSGFLFFKKENLTDQAALALERVTLYLCVSYALQR